MSRVKNRSEPGEPKRYSVRNANHVITRLELAIPTGPDIFPPPVETDTIDFSMCGLADPECIRIVRGIIKHRQLAEARIR